MTKKPAIFIASASESLDVAHTLQERLDGAVEPTVWDQGVFGLSGTALGSLTKALNRSDFGAFVFTPHDISVIRGQEKSTVRDNVIFELGLFVGRLGVERTFILTPKGQGESMRLPSDLLGLTTAQYNANREDRNLLAALGPPANQILQAIEQLGPLALPILVDEDAPTETLYAAYSEEDCLNELVSWMGNRPSTENTNVIRFVEVDGQLKLPPGTTKKLIKKAASHWNYVVHREGEQTILFHEVARASPSGRTRLTDGFW